MEAETTRQDILKWEEKSQQTIKSGKCKGPKNPRIEVVESGYHDEVEEGPKMIGSSNRRRCKQPLVILNVRNVAQKAPLPWHLKDSHG